jgi:hypothetical protein
MEKASNFPFSWTYSLFRNKNTHINMNINFVWGVILVETNELIACDGFGNEEED